MAWAPSSTLLPVAAPVGEVGGQRRREAIGRPLPLAVAPVRRAGGDAGEEGAKIVAAIGASRVPGRERGAAARGAHGKQREGQALVILAREVDQRALMEMRHLDAVDRPLHRRLLERVEGGAEGGLLREIERLAAQSRAQAVGGLPAHPHLPRGGEEGVRGGQRFEEGRLLARGPAVVALRGSGFGVRGEVVVVLGHAPRVTRVWGRREGRSAGSRAVAPQGLQTSKSSPRG